MAATDRLSTRTCYSAAHKSVNDKVVEGMVNKAGKIKVGHGLDGPLVSKEQHSKVAGYIESGRKEGVKVETGGGVIGNQGYFRRADPTDQDQPRHAGGPGGDLWSGRVRAVVRR